MKNALIFLFICMLLIGVVNGETEDIGYENMPIINSFTTSLSTAAIASGNLSIYMPANSSGLKSVSGGILSWTSTEAADRSGPIKILDGSTRETIGEGTLTLKYISTYSGNERLFDTQITFTSWNSSKITLSSTLVQTILHSTDGTFSGWSLARSANTPMFTLPTNLKSFAYFKESGNQRPMVGAGISSGIQSTLFEKNFLNTINVVKTDAGSYDYYITKQYYPIYNGYSQVEYSFGGSNYNNLGSSSTNIGGTTFTPPIAFRITEPFTGQSWERSYYQPVFNYTINPKQMSISQTATGDLQSSSGLYNTIIYYAVRDKTVGTTRPVFIHPTNGYTINFLKNASGYWNAHTTTGYNYNLGTSFPNGMPLKFYEGGNRTIDVDIIDKFGNAYTATTYITINDAGSYRYSAYPVDYVNGNFVPNSIVSIQNHATKSWTNKTVYSASDCEFLLDLGFYRVLANANGYRQGDNGLVYISEAKTDQILMYPAVTGVTGDITNSTVVLKLREASTLNPISGGTMNINGEIKTTSYTGAATFELLNNTQYKVDTIASGYNPVTQYFTPNSNPYYLDIVTTKGNIPVTYYTTVPPTAQPTPVITSPPIGGGYNQSGGFDERVCLKAPYPAGFTWVDNVLNGIACSGISGKVNQNLVLSLIIIFLCAAALANKAKGIGAIAGVIAGSAISFGMNLIPIWILVFILIVCGLVFAGLIAKGGK